MPLCSSVFPACYDGRWPHIHFEVYPDQASITDSTSAIATSQVALPQDVCEKVYATSGYDGSTANLATLSFSTASSIARAARTARTASSSRER